MAREEKQLERLKSDYNALQKKYCLPDFNFLNQNFDIEILAEDESEILLKRIRKNITEKISSGLRALEMFLNPQNAPVFIFKVIKTFSSTDKIIIESLYHKFAEYEIEAFGLENSYDEKKEAEFIKNVCADWKETSEDFDRIYKSMKANFKKEVKKSDKSYLG